MALIIEGEMPKGCLACPLKLYCPVFQKLHFGERLAMLDDNRRIEGCPIKGEIPDKHGDLIDRDEIKLKHDPLFQWFATAEMLKKVPTVVEASK